MLRNLLAILLLALTFVYAQPKGELIVALSSDPTSLFLPRAADRIASNAAWSLYNSLVWMDDSGQLVPALAESWEVSEDGLSFTFKLRQGVKFHNGEDFTAESVVATWETGKDPKNDYADIYARVASVEAVDDYTITMTNTTPNPVFLVEMASEWAMVPPAYIREVGIDEFANNPVGTGPFKFVERVSGDKIVMQANPDYWEEGLPKVATLVYRVIPESATRLAAIQTGEIHIANRLTADEVTTLEGSSEVQVVTYPNDRVYYVGFKNVGNGLDTPIIDTKVRQAFNYAVNRQGIVDAIFSGQANTIAGFTVASNLGYDDSVQPYAYDPEKAKALLAEAGYAEGFQIGMGCPADGYVNINEVCLAIQRDLGAIGVEVNLEFKTTNTFWSEDRYGAVGPMYVDSWSSEIGEALPRLQGAMLPGNTYNTWEDPTMTEYIEKISATVDTDERAKLYAELQKLMYDDPPFIYLYQPNIFEAIRTGVEGYSPRGAEEYYLKTVSVSE